MSATVDTVVYTPDEVREVWPFLTPQERAEFLGLLSAEELEALGCGIWYEAIFGREFVDALAVHHREAVEWHWEARMSLRRGEKPQYNSYFPIWSREHMKSAVARRMVVADACLSVSEANPQERGGYCLYVSRNKSMVLKHALSIETLITSPQVRKHYPLLSEVKRNVQGGSKGWQATFLNTKADFVFHFSGMDEGLAGGNLEDWRVTMMCLDDIDGREDSPVISENRFNTLTTEILPMAQDGTLVFFAQNLISRYSTMYRIQKGHARVMTDRKPTQPIKAVEGLVTKTETVDGVVKDVIVAGVPTWHLFGLDKCQDRMNREGKPAFMKERQHEVEQDRVGLVLQNWNDSVHTISKSEFASMYGTPDMPQSWPKYPFNDWARTKTKHHANVAGILTASSQSSRLPGCVFLFHPMSFPPGSSPEDVAERLLTVISPTVRVGSRVWEWKELTKSVLQRSGLESLIGNVTELIHKQRSVLAKVLPEIVKPILRTQNYRVFRGSHDQNTTGKKGQNVGPLEVFRTVFGLPFVGVNPGADGGVDRINLLQKVDYDLDHAFRGQKGYTNFYLVTEDDKSKRPVIVNGIEVYPPVPFNEALTPEDLEDGQLARYQFANWRYRDPYLTVRGEHEGELLKMSDDFGNGMMMVFHDNVLDVAPLSDGERRELMLRPNLRVAQIERDVQAGTRDRQAATSARIAELARIRQEEMQENWTHPLAEYDL